MIIRLRLTSQDRKRPSNLWRSICKASSRKRIAEAEAFYEHKHPDSAAIGGQRQVARQAFAGLLWTKQFYHYVVKDWLDGDPEQPCRRPKGRKRGRNSDWQHLFRPRCAVACRINGNIPGLPRGIWRFT